ncbi:MAG TPA: hypothetical protein VFQ68_40065 [Streptosporangiaceae bacterium]|nr:hypothetical protein [Streptosporangiaceae bacterium]
MAPGRKGGEVQPAPDGLTWPLAGAVEAEDGLTWPLARAVEAEDLAEALAGWLALVADGPAALLPAPDGLAATLVRTERVPDGPVAAGLVPPELAVAEPVVAEPAVACERGGAGLTAPAVADGRAGWSAGAVEGLNVATDSIAPATRHTARMLASSGMTVPGPENGPVRRRSRFLRRCARNSRW